MNTWPCENCGQPELRAHTISGWCWNCAYPPDGETPPRVEITRVPSDCVLCGDMHDRWSELCGPCDEWVTRQFNRVMFA